MRTDPPKEPKITLKGVPIEWDEDQEDFCPLCGVPVETHPGPPGSCYTCPSLPRKRP